MLGDKTRSLLAEIYIGNLKGTFTDSLLVWVDW